MSGAGVFWLIVGLAVVAAIIASIAQSNKEAEIMRTGSEAEKAALLAKRARSAANRESLAHGAIRAQMVCPHCQVRGQVRCKAVKNKKGISGGKATGALLTGGISMLATGLSRKEAATEAYCGNCRSTWHF